MVVQLTASLEHDLQDLARQSNSSVDQVAQGALEEFVAYRKDLNEAVRRADEDIAAGRVYEHDEVVVRIERLLQSKNSSELRKLWMTSRGSSSISAKIIPRRHIA